MGFKKRDLITNHSIQFASASQREQQGSQAVHNSFNSVAKPSVWWPWDISSSTTPHQMGNQLASPSKPGVEHSAELVNVVFKETLGEGCMAAALLHKEAQHADLVHLLCSLNRPGPAAQVPAVLA